MQRNGYQGMFHTLRRSEAVEIGATRGRQCSAMDIRVCSMCRDAPARRLYGIAAHCGVVKRWRSVQREGGNAAQTFPWKRRPAGASLRH
jgi:hypothetical protein